MGSESETETHRMYTKACEGDRESATEREETVSHFPMCLKLLHVLFILISGATSNFTLGKTLFPNMPWASDSLEEGGAGVGAKRVGYLHDAQFERKSFKLIIRKSISCGVQRNKKG